MRGNRSLQALSAAVLLVLMCVAWIMLAPIQFGGKTTYVIVTGASMDPILHRGDLALVRREADYFVGDIVTYMHPDLGAVIHRIIDKDGSRFILKGDSNSWIDSYNPVASEILGKLWIYLPKAGNILEKLLNPAIIAIITLIGSLAAMSKMGLARKSRKALVQQRGTTVFAAVKSLNNQVIENLFFVIGTIGFGAILLAIFAFTRSSTRTAYRDINYTYQGSFGYSAEAPPGVYDQDELQAGDPIFLNVTRALDVSFEFQLFSDQLSDVDGTYRLIAQVSDSFGWSRTRELKPTTAFKGANFEVHEELDLVAIRALVETFQHKTGVRRNQYTLSVIPEITLEASIAGQDLEDVFAPEMVFSLDDLQLIPKKGGEGDAPLHVTRRGFLREEHEEDASISLLGVQINVRQARIIAVVVLAASLLSAAILGIVMLRTSKAGEEARIRMKYGAMLVSLNGGDDVDKARLVEVATIRDLARIAEKTGRMILHAARDSNHQYYVQEGETTYCYRANHHNEKGRSYIGARSEVVGQEFASVQYVEVENPGAWSTISTRNRKDQVDDPNDENTSARVQGGEESRQKPGVKYQEDGEEGHSASASSLESLDGEGA